MNNRSITLFAAAAVSMFFFSCTKPDNGTPDDNDNNKPERISIPENEIWYTTTDSEELAFRHSSQYKENPITSHTYVDGKGVITFQEALTSIPEDGFVNCNKLKTIILPPRVKSLGRQAFSGCNYLTSIQLSDDLESIGEAALNSFSRMDSLFIPAKVSHIASNAFEHTNNLKYIAVDKDNKYFDTREDCNALIETATNTLLRGSSDSVIPSTVTALGDYAFSMAAFKTLDIPDNITSIGTGAFKHCLLLEEINLPEGLAEIGDEAFYGCSKLLEIKVPEKVSRIGRSAFSSCRLLKEISLPESIAEIGEAAFHSCQELTEIALSDKITVIPDYIFTYCSNLCKVEISKNITTIGTNAFSYCEKLSEITLPESVTRIEGGAFRGTAIKTITIPSKVRKLSNQVFQNCNSLESIILSEGLEFINSECIGSTRLAEITIPATIQEISYRAFVGCPELKSVYIKAITPPKHPNNYLFGSDNDLENRKIYVPRQSLEAYRTSESWKAYANIIEGYDF